MFEINSQWTFHWLLIVAMFVALAFDHIIVGIILFMILIANGWIMLREIRDMQIKIR